MKKSFAIGLAAACCLSLALPAAYAQEKPKEQGDTKIVIKDDTTPKVKKGTQAVSDGSITTAVKTRLMKDKAARAASIDVDTKDGVVTISGAVPTAADKTRIGNLVTRTTGVKSVNNELTVSGATADTSGTTGKNDTKIVIKDDTTPAVKKGAEKVKEGAEKTVDVVSDSSVTTAVKTRLMKDEVARGTHIGVKADEGVVTITGTVPTEADKIRIGQLVEQTTGVKRVVNDLTVK